MGNDGWEHDRRPVPATRLLHLWLARQIPKCGPGHISFRVSPVRSGLRASRFGPARSARRPASTRGRAGAGRPTSGGKARPTGERLVASVGPGG